MSKKRRKPHQFKKKKPFYKNRFFWFLILFFIIFSSLVYFLFFSDFFMIKKINIHGSLEKIREEEITLKIEERLKNKILFLSLENILLVNSIKIKTELYQEFPQIFKVEVIRKFPNQLNLLIEERKELAFFCQKTDCFLLDKEGIVFENSDNQDSLIKIIDQRDRKINLGEKVIERKELALILKTNLELEENLNINISEFIFCSEKLSVVTQEGWQAYFNLKEDIDWQIIKLAVLLEEKISQQEMADLEYIELRFGNFANPKYKDIQKD